MAALLMQLDTAAKGIEKIATTPTPSLYMIASLIGIVVLTWIMIPGALLYYIYSSVTPETFVPWKATSSYTMSLIVAGVEDFVVGWFLWMLYAVGKDVENPFGDDPYDLPLLSFVNKTHQDLEHLFSSQHSLPAELSIVADGAEERCDDDTGDDEPIQLQIAMNLA